MKNRKRKNKAILTEFIFEITKNNKYTFVSLSNSLKTSEIAFKEIQKQIFTDLES